MTGANNQDEKVRIREEQLDVIRVKIRAADRALKEAWEEYRELTDRFDNEDMAGRGISIGDTVEWTEQGREMWNDERHGYVRQPSRRARGIVLNPTSSGDPNVRVYNKTGELGKITKVLSSYLYKNLDITVVEKARHE